MMHRSALSLLARLAPSPAVTAVLMLAAALTAGLGIAFTNAERFVARSFTVALAEPSTATSAPPAGSALVAGTEAYWLKGTPGREGEADGHLEPAAWSSPAPLGVALGDRITIASRGAQRILEVVAIAEVPASVTRIDTSEAPGRQLIVTCRDTSVAAGPLVRFLTYAGPAQAAKSERAL